MANEKIFLAYPSSPTTIGFTITGGCELVNERLGINSVTTWEESDIVGQFIAKGVANEIDSCDVLVADITRLNFNVTYEIGYAIGREKRILLTKNRSVEEGRPTINQVGIYDTITFLTYENSEELFDILRDTSKAKSLSTTVEPNQNAPVYLIETKNKTNWISRISSRIKKAKLTYRSFDAAEQTRLSAYDAIRQVSESYGVLVPLSGSTAIGKDVHNLRAAFIAGLAAGMDKVLSILQDGDEPVPLDYRDFVITCYHPKAIEEAVREFATLVTGAWQETSFKLTSGPENFIEQLDLGASSAENEIRSLSEYYLDTDSYRRTLRGEIRLVVGRKGDGKSAIFFQYRDRVRNTQTHVVLDLKPDGYKLRKFKEFVLDSLKEGSFEHTIMAFWDYLLLLEIAFKILEQDKVLHTRNHELYEPYRNLKEAFDEGEFSDTGDFSERMSNLVDRISNDYNAKFTDSEDNSSLDTPQVTELIYRHNRERLSQAIEEYLSYKDGLWLLFDNIDKGWPTHGITPGDVTIVRALLDETRKIERWLTKKHIDVFTTIFLRNDVYELLVQETPDRGKETKVLLDWSDEEMLRELVRRRLEYNGLPEKISFREAWHNICEPLVDGEESSQYIIDRSLMRPRYLLDLINHCKSVAVNLGHEKILESDIKKGLDAYSHDILSDISLEIRDVLPEAENVLYVFIGVQIRIPEEDANKLILSDVNVDDITRITDLLLWYGFLGIVMPTGDIKYIHSTHYNFSLLKAIENKARIDGLVYYINPAFWPSLGIK